MPTLNLGLPYLAASQSQKHVTHNDALDMTDALVHLAVASRVVSTPPATLVDGVRYLLPASVTGAFAGQGGNLAIYQNQSWRFVIPRIGWRLYIIDEQMLVLYNGTTWNSVQGTVINSTTRLENLLGLGIGTSFDTTNSLSAKLNSALFSARDAASGGTGDLRFNLNKSAISNTASQLYQTNFSGRAETGLTGDDKFRIKVSPDGSIWKNALVVDPASGVVSFPSGLSGVGAGFRNRIINGSFSINQRSYLSGSPLSAGSYAHDRWKAGSAGCTYSFTQNLVDTAITITAGSLLQVIEAANMEGGTFTLSWTGTSTGKIAGGAVSSSPVTVSGLAAGANVTVEFLAGTLGQIQFEPGTIATPFERRPMGLELGLCQRYFQWMPICSGVYLGSNVKLFSAIPSFAQMRVTPTLALVSGPSNSIYCPGYGRDSVTGIYAVELSSTGGSVILSTSSAIGNSPGGTTGALLIKMEAEL